VIRAVVCDFGGVLTSPLVGSFARFQDHAGIPLESLGRAMATITERDGAHPLFELECGRMTEAAFVERLADVLREDLGRDVEMREFAEHLWAGLSRNEPMIALMAELRDAGYRMALLTNNVREWEPRWRAMLPVDEVFEVVVDSAFVGMRKPDHPIYELTCERLGVPAAECLFVDDFEHNVAAARELGMTGVVYREPEQAIAEIRAALAADGVPGGGAASGAKGAASVADGSAPAHASTPAPPNASGPASPD
jgi:putative hydrolase of the HAD superfamily